MKFDLTVDHGPCQSDLRSWCKGIAIYTLISTALGVIIGRSSASFVFLAIVIITNSCLLYGCRRENHRFVAVWFIYAILLAIGFPIAFLGAIFNFGGSREAIGVYNAFGAAILYIVVFLLCVFCTRLVYSYYLQLKNRDSKPQAVPVV